MRSCTVLLAATLASGLIGACASSRPEAPDGGMASPPFSLSSSPAPSLLDSSSAPGTTPARPDAIRSNTPEPRPTETIVATVVSTLATDGLRVRSEPRVSDDSQKLQPLLPLGSRLYVLGGPVSASG